MQLALQVGLTYFILSFCFSCHLLVELDQKNVAAFAMLFGIVARMLIPGNWGQLGFCDPPNRPLVPPPGFVALVHQSGWA